MRHSAKQGRDPFTCKQRSFNLGSTRRSALAISGESGLAAVEFTDDHLVMDKI